MQDSRKVAGAAGEAIVRRVYEEKGYRLLAANWRDRSGELDLVFQNMDDGVVIVEVRSLTIAGGPDRLVSDLLLAEKERWAFESVGEVKRRQIRRLTRTFLYAHPDLAEVMVRFDVAAVLLQPVFPVEGKAPDYRMLRLAVVESAF